MKKLLILALASLFIVGCKSDSETTEEIPTVYNGEKLTLNITGLNNSILDNPSVVVSNGSTVALNNIIDAKSSVTFENGSAGDIIYKVTTSKHIADLKGVVSNGVLTVTGTLKYTAAGVAKEYSDKSLIVNNKASEKGTSVTIAYTKPSDIAVTLTKLVDGYDTFEVEGTIKDNGDGTFSFIATGSDTNKGGTVTTVGFEGSFDKGQLSVTIDIAKLGPPPVVPAP